MEALSTNFIAISFAGLAFGVVVGVLYRLYKVMKEE